MNLAKTIVGVFHSFDRAERAVAELRTNGFMKNEISIVAQDQAKDQRQNKTQSNGRDNASAVMNNDVGRGAGLGMIGGINPAGTGLTLGTGAMTGAAGMAMDGGAGAMADNASYGDQHISDGVTTGAVVGGAAGLLAGLGALAVPGVGPLLAAGPIAGALTGGVTGGLTGGLIDYGIPEGESRRYQDHVKQGSVVAVVKADGQKADQVAEVFRRHGANEVNTH